MGKKGQIAWNKGLTKSNSEKVLKIANKNRIHWIKFFQSLLSERYEYKYNEERNIIFELKSLDKLGDE